MNDEKQVSKERLTLVVKGSDVLFGAIRNVLGRASTNIDVVSGNQELPPQPPGRYIGLLLDTGGGGYMDSLSELAALECQRVVAIRVDNEVPARVQELELSKTGAFHGWLWSSSSDLISVIEMLNSLYASVESRAARPAYLINRVIRTLQARRLYSLLRGFSHGHGDDITNQFLAPARILLLCGEGGEVHRAWQTIGDSILKRFKSSVCDPCEAVRETRRTYGELAGEICVVHDKIETWFHSKTYEDGDLARAQVDNLSRMMELLTECRVLAGGRTQPVAGQPTDSPAPIIPIVPSEYGGLTDDTIFRVLVVDDHASSWRTVFQHVEKEVEKSGYGVIFEFSNDTEWVWCNGSVANSFWRQPLDITVLGEYDLILLDVFIGEKKGTDLLEKIRDLSMAIPVVLWTTSRDVEIPASAQLANGFLFKKTCGCREISDIICRWTKEGRSRRMCSLPNPTFDQAIRRLDLRRLTQKFGYWALRELDSFHALDNEVYHFFTDHGGRHTIRLFELMEQALRPCLIGGGMFSASYEEREIELFCLYLAVLCHEFGMFPIDGDAELSELDSERRKSYQEIVRTLHPMRGMLLFANDSPDYWPDHQGRELASELDGLKLPNSWKPQTIRRILAVLTGYHSRFLEKLCGVEGDGAFLQWQESAEKKFNGLGKALSGLGLNNQPIFQADTYKTSLANLKEFFDGSEVVERLPCWCALLRFIDALDMDYTRNPIKPFLAGSQRTAKQNRENLKRDVCAGVKILGGCVKIEMRAPKPQPGWVHDIFQDSAGVPSHWEGIVSNPWAYEGPSRDLKAIFEVLDKCLLNAWEIIMCPEKRTEYQKVSEIFGLDAADFGRGFDTELGPRLASASALAVILETRDEYQAIVDSKLNKRIRLDEGRGITWSEPFEIGKLITLQIAKRQYIKCDCD